MFIKQFNLNKLLLKVSCKKQSSGNILCMLPDDCFLHETVSSNLFKLNCLINHYYYCIKLCICVVY